jgi:hypothetical protein
LSQGAIRRYAKSYDEIYQTKWEKDTGTECCGDLMLAKALGDAHVEFYASWPLLQSEQPSTLDYTRKHWCAPAVSWHHIDGNDLTRQWDIEKKWTTANGWKKPYLYRDAYHDSVEPHIETQKVGWDLNAKRRRAARRVTRKKIKIRNQNRLTGISSPRNTLMRRTALSAARMSASKLRTVYNGGTRPKEMESVISARWLGWVGRLVMTSGRVGG